MSCVVAGSIHLAWDVCVVASMEAIDQLVTFAQKRDVFICDFVAAVKICQASLHTLYEDRATAYSTDEFGHSTIFWIAAMNKSILSGSLI